MEYDGTISERRGVVRYWQLRDDVTQTQETWVMIDPYYDPIDVTEGVQVTVDLRGLPVATAKLISRRELAPDELERRIPSAIIGADPLESFQLSLALSADEPFVPEILQSEPGSNEEPATS
jgi:hypothetical protein